MILDIKIAARLFISCDTIDYSAECGVQCSYCSRSWQSVICNNHDPRDPFSNWPLTQLTSTYPFSLQTCGLQSSALEVGRYVEISWCVADIDIIGIVSYPHFSYVDIVSVTSEVLVILLYFTVIFQTF